MVLCKQQPLSDTVTVVIIWGWGAVTSHLVLSAKVKMTTFSRKANVGFGEARSKIATAAMCLMLMVIFQGFGVLCNSASWRF